MNPEIDEKCLLDDETIYEICLGHPVNYKGEAKDWLNEHYHGVDFIAIAQAQAEKAYKAGEGNTREKLIKLLIANDVLCSEEDAIRNGCVVCKNFWQALEKEIGGKE